MKNCFRRGLPVLSATLIISIFATLTHCTSVDDSLGFGLIPERQKMIVGIDTLGTETDQLIKTYVTYTDTIYTMNQGRTMFGSLKSDRYGLTTAASIFQFMPASPRVDTTASGFGYNVQIDSIMLVGYFMHMAGKSDVEQKFNIFMVNDTIRTDTIHYMNFPYEDYIDNQNKPLFSFNYKGDKTEVEFIKLDVTPEGMAFVEELMADTTYYIDTDIATSKQVSEAKEKFRVKFPGFAIAPDAGSPEDASIYASVLTYGFLSVCFHNYESEAVGAAVKDTTELSFYFDDSNSYYPRNNNVLSVRHDYTGTEFDGIITATEPMAMAGDKGYVQGLGGVATLLEFPDQLFTAINDLKEDPTDDIMVNQALMFIDLENGNDTQTLDNAHQKLGSYIRYGGVYGTPIPDYAYYYQDDYTLAYGGYLNRTFGYYKMDITAWLQRALNQKTERKFTIGPGTELSPPTEALAWSDTALEASPTKPIRLKLTYTLIKRNQ